MTLVSVLTKEGPDENQGSYSEGYGMIQSEVRTAWAERLRRVRGGRGEHSWLRTRDWLPHRGAAGEGGCSYMCSLPSGLLSFGGDTDSSHPSPHLCVLYVMALHPCCINYIHAYLHVCQCFIQIVAKDGSSVPRHLFPVLRFPLPAKRVGELCFLQSMNSE